jgi:protein-S-isoprenylcysteine O-methyltransferase Ste14
MVFIGLGGLGFLAGYAFELTSLKAIPVLKPALWLMSVGLVGFSLAQVCLRSEQFWVPGWLAGLGWGLLPVAVLLLTYSLFLEVPPRRTYLSPGPGPRLVRSGTYALVRHPSVLWFGLLLLSLLIVSRSYLLALALPLWLLLDILWVVLQERQLRRAFPDYVAYQQTTPMLIPNRQSLKACLRSFRPLAAWGWDRR